ASPTTSSPTSWPTCARCNLKVAVPLRRRPFSVARVFNPCAPPKMPHKAFHVKRPAPRRALENRRRSPPRGPPGPRLTPPAACSFCSRWPLPSTAATAQHLMNRPRRADVCFLAHPHSPLPILSPTRPRRNDSLYPEPNVARQSRRSHPGRLRGPHGFVHDSSLVAYPARLAGCL